MWLISKWILGLGFGVIQRKVQSIHIYPCDEFLNEVVTWTNGDTEMRHIDLGVLESEDAIPLIGLPLIILMDTMHRLDVFGENGTISMETKTHDFDFEIIWVYNEMKDD